MTREKSSREAAHAPPQKRARFEVSAALFEELGERLVSKPEIALAELIKNAYDADSASCELSLTHSEIVVTDYGHGMTESEFLNNWMVVSTQKKGLQRFSRKYGRNMAGSKGVGRFSARFLGNVVTLTSVAIDPKSNNKSRITAKFDWKKIAQQGAISAVTIIYTSERVPANTKTGTTLRITELREEAKTISPSKVKTDILRLTNPAAGLERPPFAWPSSRTTQRNEDPGFEVVFADPMSGPDGLPVSESVAAEILSAYVGRVRLEVNEKGRLKYQVYWNRSSKPIASDEFAISKIVKPYTLPRLKPRPGQDLDARGLPIELESIPHLPLADGLHSPVFIDLRFFPKRKGTFSDLPVNGKMAQGWLSEHASLAVVDNNFAMPAYADQDSDWLGIDASKARNERAWQSIFTPALFPMSPADRADPARNPMLALPRGTQVVGRIHIATSKRPAGAEDDSDDWLQPNMDRESLRANGAFRLLWHISRFATELIAHFDRELRLKEEVRENKARRQAARSALSSAIGEIKASKQIEPEYRRRLVDQLQEAQVRLEEAAKYEQDARFSLELMSLMGVMAGFMTHEFEKTLGTLKEAAEAIRSFSKLSPALAENADTVFKNELTLANYLDYMRLFVSKSRDPHPQSFKAKAQVGLAVKTLGSLSEAHGINTEVDIDPKLMGPYVPIAAYNGIVINLVSNAMKALVPKVSSEPRKIRIYATNDGTRHTLVCADNGIGIPDFLRTRIWDPLYTTTADGDNPLGSGLGLGLSVVQRVVNKLGGKIDLMDSAPPGFVTAFRVSFPMQAAER